jgi:hypothetical protein
MGTFVVPHIHVSITGKEIILGLLVPDGFQGRKISKFCFALINGYVAAGMQCGMMCLFMDYGIDGAMWHVGSIQ